MKNAYQLVAEFRLNLLRRDTAARAELLAAYQNSFRDIQAEIKSLTTRLLAGETPSLLSQRARMLELQRQVQERIMSLSQKAATLTIRNQQAVVSSAKDEAVRLIAAQARKALDELTDTATARKLIEAAGFTFRGTQEAGPGEAPWQMFNDPQTGSTLMLQKVTPKTLAEKIIESRMKFASGEAGVSGSFSTFPHEAFTQLVGVSRGNPIHEIFSDLAEDLGDVTADRIKQALIRGVAMGESPDRVTRRIMREAAAQDGNPTRPPVVVRRLQMTVRNETFRAYREATRLVYKQSSIVKGWRWVSRQSPLTCVVCWANDGKVFPLNTPFASHPNCRCVSTPVLDNEEAYITGPEAFDELEPGVQKSILGDRAFAAFAAGDIDSLEDFVKVVRSRKWGESRVRRSLEQLLGRKQAAA